MYRHFIISYKQNAPILKEHNKLVARANKKKNYRFNDRIIVNFYRVPVLFETVNNTQRIRRIRLSHKYAT